MTMHLHHPALSLSGKKRGKQKWASAEQKRKAMELKSEWDSKVKQWASMSNTAAKPLPTKKYVSPTVPEHRRAAGKSIDSGVTGAVNVKQTQHYTGDRLLGITIVHKSCLQPVFSQEQAVEAAHMRR